MLLAARLLLARVGLLRPIARAAGATAGGNSSVAANQTGTLDALARGRGPRAADPAGQSRDGAEQRAEPPFVVGPASRATGERHVDDDAIRAEVIAFLDRVEARERRRPEWSAVLERAQRQHGEELLAELADAKERFAVELERERDASRRDARLLFEQAEEAAEQRVAEAREHAGRLLEAARGDARELVRRAHGEAEQTLEWSRAQGAEIVRRSQRVAADRFTQDPRPWLAAEPPSR